MDNIDSVAADVAASSSSLASSQVLNVPATIGQDGLVVDLNGAALRLERPRGRTGDGTAAWLPLATPPLAPAPSPSQRW